MLWPKTPYISQLGDREIYKGWCEDTSIPGQHKILKTKDWVEKDLNGLSERMSYGGLLGFKAGFFLSMVDIFLIKQIKERKAQIARCAFFTVPITTMGAGWMGGVEFAKICFGRDNEFAWFAGAGVPGGIMGIWTKNLWGGVRTSLALGVWGAAYQYSVNNNLMASMFPNFDNPNIPHTFKLFNRERSMFYGTPQEGSTLHEDLGLYPKDPGPSWKKWEDEE